MYTKLLLLSTFILFLINSVATSAQQVDSLSSYEEYEDRLKNAMRHHNEVLTKDDSLSLQKYTLLAAGYRNDENYLSVQKEIIDVIINELSVPYSIELAKLLFIDDTGVMELVLENLAIKKRNPQSIDDIGYYKNIFISALTGSYERKTIFIKHVLFSKLLDDCMLESKLVLSHPWSYNKDENMSIFKILAYTIDNDSLFNAALKDEMTNKSISECKRNNLLKIKDNINKHENNK